MEKLVEGVGKNKKIKENEMMRGRNGRGKWKSRGAKEI